MIKISRLSYLTFFLLLFAITACKKEPKIILPVINSFTVSSETVAWNGSVTLTWSSTGDYAKLNNQRVDASGSTTFELLTVTSTYTLVSYNDDGESEPQAKTVVVGAEPIPAPTLESLIYPTGIIPYGDSITVQLTLGGGPVTSVNIDGISIPLVGSTGTLELPRQLETKEHTLTITGPGGIITQKFTTTVGDWTTSWFGLLSHGYCLFDRVGYKDASTNWEWHMYTEDQMVGSPFYDDKYYYDPVSMMYSALRNGVLIGYYPWNLSGNILTVGALTYTIEIVNQTQLVLIEKVVESSNPADISYLKWVYKKSN